MFDKEIEIDHRSLFKLFLVVLAIYAMMWGVRTVGWYLFGYWGSFDLYDQMIMLLIFWIPVLLFLIILLTLIFALSAEGGRRAPYPPIIVYAAIFFGLTVYFIWLIMDVFIMVF